MEGGLPVSNEVAPIIESISNTETVSTVSSLKKKTNERSYVEITNLSYVPNAQIETYFGQINLFYIRESNIELD